MSNTNPSWIHKTQETHSEASDEMQDLQYIADMHIKEFKMAIQRRKNLEEKIKSPNFNKQKYKDFLSLNCRN